MQNNNIPKIRFNGFTAPWEQRKLGDIVERVVRKNTNNESSLPLTISAQYGLVDQITYFNNRVASRDVSNYYLVLNGEFAYNKSTSDGFPFGAVKRLDLYEKGVLSTLYIVFSIKNQSEIDSDYLTVFFDTDRWHKGVSERAAEGARNHGLLNISADDFFDIDIFLPRHKEEQVAIGSYLRHLDNLITLHQRKYDKLTNVKKSMLEKLFPKNGASVPKIRFKGFSDAWEQRKLEDVARILGGNAWKASDYSDDGEYLVVTIANVSGEVIINDSVGNRISCDNPDVYLLNKGDILVSLTGNVGRVSKMSNIKGLLNQRVGKILPNNSDINADFLFHVLRNPHFERAMIDAGQGAAQKNIRNDDVLNYAFFLPVEKDEQNIIAHYFNRLDNLITLHQCKLEKLKHIKQACLEQMFL